MVLLTYHFLFCWINVFFLWVAVFSFYFLFLNCSCPPLLCFVWLALIFLSSFLKLACLKCISIHTHYSGERLVDRITNWRERAPLCETMRIGLVSNKCSLTLGSDIGTSWTSSCHLANPASLFAIHMAQRAEAVLVCTLTSVAPFGNNPHTQYTVCFRGQLGFSPPCQPLWLSVRFWLN